MICCSITSQLLGSYFQCRIFKATLIIWRIGNIFKTVLVFWKLKVSDLITEIDLMTPLVKDRTSGIGLTKFKPVEQAVK